MQWRWEGGEEHQHLAFENLCILFLQLDPKLQIYYQLVLKILTILTALC